MRTTIIAILLIVLTSIITGCKSANDQGTPGDASAAPTTAQTFDLGELSYIFEIPAESVDVAVTLDMEETVEALIPVEGGSISATSADGTVYTLEIPADALLNETMISLTPVTSISGMPFGNEQTYAVQFGPEGLFLYNFAILTITPAEEIPLDEQIVFGYQEEGEDLILAAPVVDSSEIQIQLLHFSGNGVTKGLLADIEPVRELLGGDAQRRLETVVNRALIHKRQGADVDSDFLAEAFRQYEEQVIKPRVAAAGESCANGQLAIETVLLLEGMRRLAGQSSLGSDALEKYPGLLDTATQVCVNEEWELCVEKHVIHRMIPVWRGFERLYAKHGKGATADNAVLREARDLTVLCLTFILKFESTALLNEGLAERDIDEWESTVTSEIILRFNPDNGTISGEAKLVNEHHEFTSANPECSTVSVTGGGVLKVYQLKYFAPIYDDLGPVSDIELAYLPGNTSEFSSYTCPANVSGENTLPFWSPVFFLLHYAEWDEDYYLDELRPSVIMYVRTDWEIFGDEYFAKKDWLKEDGEMVEGGTFKLYHAPGE